MTPQRLLKNAILPALAELAARGIPDTADARRFVLAIALQESSLRCRRQVVGGAENGPAVSYWQFEKGGGCVGVLRHPAAAPHMAALCALYDVQATPEALWAAMQYNDVLAAAAARLLVYALPSALPKVDSIGWGLYLSSWRPGKPRFSDWPDNWNTATAVVMGEAHV